MKDSYWLPERLFWSAYLATRMRGQQKTPYWSQEKLEKVQNSRVRKIVRFAARYVPFYRELFRRSHLNPDSFSTVADLSRLPVITPLQVRKDAGQFEPEGKKLDTLKLVSSGTTGVPRWIYHDAAAIFQNAAHGERSRFFYSCTTCRRQDLREALIVAPLKSSVQMVQRFNRTKAWFPGIVSINRMYFSLLDSMEDTIKKINEFKPHVIRSYGSGLNMLCEHSFRTGQKFHRPELMIYSADAMSPPLKRIVMEDLGIPVYSYYSSVECPQLGYECEKNRGYHLNEDAYPIRIVDENYRNIPDGEMGKILISNLVNRGTVLFNYELGDEGRIIPGSCACGRTQRLLSLEIFKVGDSLTMKDGYSIHPLRFIKALTDGKDLWQHQIIQKDNNSFTILLVADPAADRTAMMKRLNEEFEKWFQGRIQYTLEFVDRIELTPGGKQRAVVLKLNGE